MGLMNQFLERKVMLVVYLPSLGASELRVLSCRGFLVSEAGCILTYSPFVNKENSSSNLELCLSRVYWFNEYVQLYG